MFQNTRIRSTLSIFFALEMILGLSYCLAQAPLSNPQQPSGGTQSGSKIVDNRAILKYVNDSPIVAQADGLITNISVEEGKAIGEGQVLVELDTRLAMADLKVATKGYEADKAKAENESEIEFNLLAYQLAKLMTESQRTLRDKGATSISEFRKTELEEDKARLSGVIAELKLKTDRLTSEVSLAKKEAAQVQVELRQMKAPFEGIVAERQKQPNDYVRTGEKILRLVGMEKIHVIGRIPAQDVGGLPHLLENAPATAVVSVFGKEARIPGTISFVSPVQGEDGKYRVKMEIANMQENGHWIFRDGMLAQLIIDGSFREPTANRPNPNAPVNRR